MADAIQTLIANLQQNKYSTISNAEILASYDNLIAALNEIETTIITPVSAILVESGASSKISALPAAASLTGTELAIVVQGGADVQTTTQAIANLSGAPIGANPTASAGPAAVNGSATTYMRSDGAPAVQKCSNSQFGLAEPDNDTIQSTTAGVIRSKRNDVSFNFSGVPGNSQKFTYISNRAWSLPASLTGSQAVIGTNPTATLTVTLNKNGSSIGTIAFSTGGVPTLTFASLVNFAIGDVLTAVCPASADATGADIAATLQGFLT